MGLSSVLPDLKHAFSGPQLGQTLGSLGSTVANVGNSASGVIPGGGAPTINMPMPKMRNPNAINPSPTLPPIAAPVNSTNGMIPSVPMPTAPTFTPPGMANGVQVGDIKGGDFNSVYGVDTGTALTNLFNAENPYSSSGLAQAVINANQPNVQQGLDTLNTGLAASGISPSSSVSAIENANYMGGVQQQNLAEQAQFALKQQEMQQNLLEHLLPSQQQRQTDSSGWSIFGDIMSGIGDIFSI